MLFLRPRLHWPPLIRASNRPPKSHQSHRPSPFDQCPKPFVIRVTVERAQEALGKSADIRLQVGEADVPLLDAPPFHFIQDRMNIEEPVLAAFGPQAPPPPSREYELCLVHPANVRRHFFELQPFLGHLAGPPPPIARQRLRYRLGRSRLGKGQHNVGKAEHGRLSRQM